MEVAIDTIKDCGKVLELPIQESVYR